MNILSCESYRHEKVGDHVDEVLFLQPVVVSGCHILDEDEDLQPESLGFRGVTDPQSFLLKIYARDLKSLSGRFQQICPSFVYQESAEGLLSLEPILTDHLVVRGNYKSLSLVVYGVRADGTALSGGNVAVQYSPFAAINSVPAGLLPGLRSGNCEAISPLYCLKFAEAQSGISREGLIALRRAVQSWHTSGGTCVPPADALLQAANANIIRSLMKEDPDALFDAEGEVAVLDEEAEAMVHMSVSWTQEGLLPSSTALNGCSSLDRVLAGVAAAQLLCSEPSLCYRWVAASGLHWLGSVLIHSRSGPAALQLAALRAIERASCHSFGCEVLLSWWQPGPDGAGVPSKAGPSMLYETLVSLLLRPQLRPISLLSASIIRRLRTYELSACLQRAVEGAVTLWCTERGDMGGNVADAVEAGDAAECLQMAAAALKSLVDVVVSSESDVTDWPAALSNPSPAREIDAAAGIPLPSKSFPGLSGPGKGSSFAHAVDFHFLQLLLERRTLPLLGMLFSSPQLPHLQGQAATSAIALLQATYALLLPLLNCSTGLLFLASQGPAVAAIARVLSQAGKDAEEGQRWAWLPRRWALSLAGGGYLCSPRQLSNMLSVGVAAVSALDEWLGSEQGSRESLVALHGLVSLRANTASQQALIAALHLPQAWKALMRALPTSPDTPRTTANATGSAMVEAQYATMLLNTLVLDSTPASFNIWLPHSATLQVIAQHWIPIFESTPPILGAQPTASRLAEIQDAADVGAVWHKRGGPGLVQLVATLTACPGAKPAQPEGGTDGLEVTANPAGATGGGGGAGVGGTAGGGGSDGKGSDGTGAAAGAAALSMLLSLGTVKLPTALCLLVPLMNHGVTVTALYEEDVLGVMQHILGQCASSLSTLSPANGLAGDWIQDNETSLKERHILNIVLPALLILLAALRRVQMAGSQYRSTKLVEVLIRLHSAVRSVTEFHLTVPPADPSGNSAVVAAVRHALASVLAAWPVAGFSPSLLPRLLSQGSNSEVVSASWEPVNASGLFSLLGDMLPEFRCSRSSGADVGEEALWVHAAASILGLGTAPELSWQTRAPHVQQLVRALGSHTEALAGLLLRFLPLKSEVLHQVMARFVMRLATADAEAAIVLVRPVVDFLQNAVATEQASVGPQSETSNKPVMWEMLQALNFLTPLAMCAASKASLLQTAVVPVLVHFVDKLAVKKVEASRWQKHALASLNILRALCNPGIAMNLRNSFARRVVEDCPKYADCCEVAKVVLHALKDSEPGPTTEALLRVFMNLASHDLGRAALASFADPVRPSDTDSAIPRPPEVPETPLLSLWRRIASACDSKAVDSSRLRASLVRSSLFSSRACIALANKGTSDAGLAALCALAGVDTSGGSMEHSVLDVLGSVRSFLETLASDTSLEASKNVILAEAREAVDSLITLIQSAPRREVEGGSLDDLIKAVLAKLPTARPISERKQAVATTKGANPTLEPLNDSAVWLHFDKDSSKRMTKPPPQSFDSVPADLPWECRFPLPNVFDATAAKRKLPGSTDPRPDIKRPRGDTSIPAPDIPSGPPPGAPPSSGGPLANHRRDNFRQRKPNTSRPTSMHVDDYQARERAGGDNNIPGPPPRSLGGGGRPPSIHVDEFMKREKHVVVGAPTSTTSASGNLQTTPASVHSQAPSTFKDAATPLPASRPSHPVQTSATSLEAVATSAPSRQKDEQETQAATVHTTAPPPPPTTAPPASQSPHAAAPNQPPYPTTSRALQPSETAPLILPPSGMAPNAAPMPRMPPPGPRPPQMAAPGWGPMPPMGADGSYMAPQGLRPLPGPMWVPMDPSIGGPMQHMGGRMDPPTMPPAPSHIPPPPPPRPEFPRPQHSWDYHSQGAPHQMDVQAVMRPQYMGPGPGMQYAMRPPPLPYQQNPYPPPLPAGGPGMDAPAPVSVMEAPTPAPLPAQPMEGVITPHVAPTPVISQFVPPMPPLPVSLAPPPAPVKQPDPPTPPTAVPLPVPLPVPGPVPVSVPVQVPVPAPVPAVVTAPPPAAAATPDDDEAAEVQRLFSSPEAIKALIADQAKLAQLLQEHPKIMTMLQAKLSGGAP